ncbi:hypothetical protein IMG5_125070, partial [Ichthyophthirius multifiliis]
QEDGPIKTIQQAINEADAGCVIKISPGLYQENLKINKPSIRLEPKEKIGDIIIIGSKGPVILIDLQKQEKCHLLGLKLAHTGMTDEFQNSKNNTEQHERDKNSKVHQIQTTPEKELVNYFHINKHVHSIVTIFGGKLFIEDCLLSLNFIVYTFKQLLPAILVNEQSELILNRSEIKGHQSQETIGVLVQNGDVLIKDCKIHNHRAGGIHILSQQTNFIKILNTKILQNDKVGIQCQGVDSRAVIEGNRIERTKGPGIRTGIANKSSIVRNEIRLNSPGIEIISSDPYIMDNKIDKNNTSGIVSLVFQDYRCDGRIKSNISISGNKQYGISCSGIKNYTKIEQNQCISYNKKSGIRADENAEIAIYKNNISKNLGQGVLLVETSSAIVEKNEIYDNLKANIALGGSNSVDTLIVDNIIHSGRCEGIFIIDGGKTWIIRNKIYENNDGIISVTSIPVIQNNQIYNNKSHGVMFIKDSRPDFSNNQVYNNDCVGIFIRDKSNGVIKKNDVYDNKIQLIVEKRQQCLANIREQNNLQGDVRIPQNYDCNIF